MKNAGKKKAAGLELEDSLPDSMKPPSADEQMAAQFEEDSTETPETPETPEPLPSQVLYKIIIFYSEKYHAIFGDKNLITARRLSNEKCASTIDIPNFDLSIMFLHF